MEETQIYSKRLQGITEKRRIVTQMEGVQRELEQQKLKLQQLKRKSLRDRWLMDGLPNAPEGEMENPLSKTEGEINQLERELQSLQSQLVYLENPEVGNLKMEGTRVAPAPQTQLVNGEKDQHRETSSEDRKADSTITDVRGGQQRTPGPPIPAPRGKKPETSEKNQTPQAQDQDKALQGYDDQNVEDVRQNSENQNRNLEHHLGNQEHQTDTCVENLDQNLCSRDIKDSEDEQSEEHFNKNLENLEQSSAVDLQNYDDKGQKLMSQPGNQNTSNEKEDEGIVELAARTHQIPDSQEGNESDIQSQKASPELLEHVQNRDPEYITADQEPAEGENQEKDNNEGAILETQHENQAPTSPVKELNESELQSLAPDQNQDPNSSSKVQNQDAVSDSHTENQEHVQLTEDQNRGPRSLTQDQIHELKPMTQDGEAVSEAQYRKQELVPNTQDAIPESRPMAQDQNQEPIPETNGQNQEHTLSTQDQSQSSVSQSKNQSQVQDSAPPTQGKDSLRDSGDRTTNTIPSSNEKNQVHIPHVVVVAGPGPNPSVQLSSPAQQVSSTVSGALEEVQPLLNRAQEANSSSPSSPLGANTAESRKEKTRAKEKTCQCCVLM